MAIEDVVIRIVGDTSKLDPTINKLKSIGAISQKQANEFKQASDKIQGELDQTARKTQTTGKQMGGTFSFMKNQILGLGAAFAGAFALQKIVGDAIKNIREFGKQLSNLSAITGATGKDLELLKQKALEIGRTTTISATQAVEAFKLMGSAKPELLENADALAKVTEQAIILAEASGQELPIAIEHLGNTLNAMELDASEAGRVVNVLAAASKLGAKEVPFISEALSKFGGVAASAGVSIEESAAAIEILGAKIPQAEIVGTGLRQVMLDLQIRATKQGREFRGLSGELELLGDKVNDVTFLQKEFGDRGVLVMQTLIKQRGALDELTKGITGTNVAIEQQLINTDNLDSALKRAGNAWEVFTLSLNDGKGILSTVVGAFAGFLNVMSGSGSASEEFATNIEKLEKALGRQLTFLEKSVIAQAGFNEEQLKLIKSTKEEASATDRVTDALNRWREAKKKQTEETEEGEKADEAAIITLKSLQERLQKAQEILGDQAAQGKLTTEAIKEYEAASKALENAQKLVENAIGKTNEKIKEQKAVVELAPIQRDVPDFETKTREPIEGLQELFEFSQKTGRDINELMRQAQAEGVNDYRVYIDNLIKEEERLAEETEKAREETLEKINEGLMIASELTNSFFAIEQQANEARAIEAQNQQVSELAALDKKLKQKIISEEQYDIARTEIEDNYNAKAKKIRREQAEAAKKQAVFNALIDGASAVLKSLTIDPTGILGIFVGALAAAKAAAIIGTPIPEFHKGKIDIDKGGDEFYAKLKRHESVVSPEATKMYREELEAANKMELEKLIYRKYVIPQILMEKQKMGRQADALSVNVDMWNLDRRLRDNNKLTIQTNFLLRELQGNYSQRRQWN